MPRHLIDISDLSRQDIDRLFEMADTGPSPGELTGLTYLSAFFQESTRTRLGFASAAARQGATVLDMGSADRLRVEPAEDQQMVIAGLADITAVRHWDPAFTRDLASREQTRVVNAGTSDISHPTQALIDIYTLMKTFPQGVAGLNVTFVGKFLRSAQCFRKVASPLGIHVSQCRVSPDASRTGLSTGGAQIQAADVIYVQSLSETDYGVPNLNSGSPGRVLPPWALEAVERSRGLVMHALPRGPELPDSLMWSRRSLVSRQVEHGLAVRGAVLRWLVESS
jgi:aspartate carbamoyltransferase catalytic subunit